MLLSSQCLLAAQECAPFRLDDPGKSMEHMPILDQDAVGYCGSYSATQLADAWRFSHGDTNYSHITSPLLIGLSQNGDDSTGVQIEEAINALHHTPSL